MELINILKNGTQQPSIRSLEIDNLKGHIIPTLKSFFCIQQLIMQINTIT